MNQIFSTACAVILFSGLACFANEPCCRPAVKLSCTTLVEPCPPPPLKKSMVCTDDYREPYRLVYPPRCYDTRLHIPFSNTDEALLTRQLAILRQREIIAFERGLLAATPPITQPSLQGVTLYGGTEGAGGTEERCAPIPPAPPYPGPSLRIQKVVVAPSPVHVKPAPVAEHMSAKTEYVVAKPVPSKPGFVYCPYVHEVKYIDIRGFTPGVLAKDPYSGRVFRVP